MADETKKIIKVSIQADKKEIDKETEKIKKSFSEEFSKGFSDSIKSKFKILDVTDGKAMGAAFGNAAGNAILKAGQAFVDLLKESWEELDKMVQYSMLSNAETRRLAFTYGFSGSQAYGYQKAMDIMGFRGEEDLMFASGSQKEKFQELMNKYNERYTELYDSGFFEDYMNFQYEMEDMKQELMTEVIGFFMDNKDTIKAAMEWMIKLAEIGIEGFDRLIAWLNGGREQASNSDIIKSYSTNNHSTNVKIDNTFNGVNSSDRGWLANAGQMTYEQIIKALT